ncbi:MULTISPECIES: glycosyltransferase family 4 protein [unclassified Leclercia]|uniref:glycosyltransferase family 4 protein n=1 Tax=unclassified Leclercia TaxID=2627398 RepID=UPI00257A9FBB|nr:MULTISPECIES: glycosyltransferase family 4 protein [unclassified Leclercia]
MKVLYIITKADEIGGAQVHVRDLAKKLVAEGHDVHVIVGENGALVNQLKQNNIEVTIVDKLIRDISPLKDFQAVINIRQLIKKLAPDIIGLHSSKAGIIGRLSALGLGIPVVFTAHGWAFADGVGENKKKLYIFIERSLAPLVNKIITVSNQDKELALKYKVTSDYKQVVIHNGMPDLAEEIDLTSKELRSKIKIISVARFSEQKDHETLLIALSQVEYKNWILTLVGKGPKMEYIKSYACQLGIRDKIEFLGECNDVSNLLSNSDIFTLITNWEGLPLSIIEAMRASLPVVASDVGGVRELIDDNHTGFLIKHKDANQLTQIFEKLFSDSSLRQQMGHSGRVKYLANFTFDDMYYKTLSLYKGLIKRS